MPPLPLQTLRSLRWLARLVLAWFVLALGVAIASPLVKPQGIELVCASGGAMKLIVNAVDSLMPAAGAGGLTMNLPLQRQFRDIHAASAHIALTWDVHAAAYGQSALGLQPQGGLLL